MWARYRFAVTFRLDPARDVSLDPDSFETSMTRAADDPGEPGWRFFRDTLWRGELADPAHFSALTESALGVTVLSVDYRAFETDEEYRLALRAAIEDDLPSFKDDSVDAVLNKYFGSTTEVR
ncbi:Uncharacterized protein HSRCO_2455 [Halanaeroarchaeum sp. HSR-CO]|uniref:LWR-salt protein n=1 Tax=Halanaeroarchaeum sp. HSR-CO TaxID=2866382 RepID=UPI00217E1091|nr:LWR-salt protein [Halanaeroarchaeum sp. HSR-CO]UWG48719.1 Uncharacterized protein HSRCO_2455 [Halanaeroarchaeum sp. HSR-CO]